MWLDKTINTLKYYVYSVKIGVYTISNKRLDFPSMCKTKMIVKEEDISYFTLSANTITLVNTINGYYFYREVLQHEEIDSYFEKSLERFLELSVQGVAKINFEREFPIQTQFKKEYIREFRVWLREKFLMTNGYRKLVKSDYVLRREGFSVWRNVEGLKINNRSLDEIGLRGIYDHYPEIAPLLLSFLSGCAYCYRVNRFNRYETFYAQKSISSYVLAKMLGKSALLTEALPVELIIDNSSQLGVLSPRAIGIRAQDSSMEPTPANQKDLSCLCLIDLLCCQPDHMPNNYNIVSGKMEGESTICAFDNDNMFTFFPIFNVKHFKSKNCSKIISSDGLINLPHLDKEFAETLLSISLKELDYELKKYLNIIQLVAFHSRFKGLRRALRKTIENKPHFLLEETEWCDLTMQEERSGKYGITYLTLLDEYVEDQRRYLKEVACE